MTVNSHSYQLRSMTTNRPLPSFRVEHTRSGGKDLQRKPTNRGQYDRPTLPPLSKFAQKHLPPPTPTSPNNWIFIEDSCPDALTHGSSYSKPLSDGKIIDKDLDQKIAKMIAELLSDNGFAKEPARDQNYRIRCGQTVAEVQGCSDFCKKVFEYTNNNPFVLSPSYLRSGQSLSKTYLSLKYKRIGHVFNLDGMIRLPDGTEVNLAGGNETFLFPPLRAAFEQFASHRKDLINNKMCISITESLTRAVWHENASDRTIHEIHSRIHNATYHDPIIVGSGYVWHSTQVIFYKKSLNENYLLYCNRGSGYGKKSGIVVLNIHNMTKITEDFLKRLTRRLEIDEPDYTSLDKIKKELNANEISYFQMKEQKVGNCVHASYKAVFYALFLIEQLKENPAAFGFSILEDKLECTKQIYKEFSEFDASTVLEDFLIDLEEPIPLKASTKEGQYYWEGLKKVASLLGSNLRKYSEARVLGKKKKVPYKLLQKAIKSTNVFQQKEIVDPEKSGPSL